MGAWRFAARSSFPWAARQEGMGVRGRGAATGGDFLAVAVPDSPAHRKLDWATVTVGSPLTLAAPAKPGTYEIRYIAGDGREVLARIPIEVVP